MSSTGNGGIGSSPSTNTMQAIVTNVPGTSTSNLNGSSATTAEPTQVKMPGSAAEQGIGRMVT